MWPFETEIMTLSLIYGATILTTTQWLKEHPRVQQWSYFETLWRRRRWAWICLLVAGMWWVQNLAQGELTL